MNTKNKNILLIINIFLLLGSFINGLPYGYFTFLRLITCVISLIMFYNFYNLNNYFWAYTFVGIAILFNPIIPIYLNREIWLFFDVASAILMAFNLKTNL